MRHAEHPLPYLRDHRMAHRLVVGGALVLLGVGQLLVAQGLLPRHALWLVAPAALVLSALVRVARRRDGPSLVQAFMACVFAAWLVAGIEHLGGWTFHDTWPVLLIVGGIAIMARALPGGCLRQGADR